MIKFFKFVSSGCWPKISKIEDSILYSELPENSSLKSVPKIRRYVFLSEDATVLIVIRLSDKLRKIIIFLKMIRLHF